MRLSTNLSLVLQFLGIGPNAESALRENFEKIDQMSIGGATIDTITMTDYVRGSEDTVQQADTLSEAIGKLEARIFRLENPLA